MQKDKFNTGKEKPLTGRVDILKRKYYAILRLLRFYGLLLKYYTIRSLVRFIYNEKRGIRTNETVLTFCVGGIGDIVLATPFYESLKKARPDCMIDVIVPQTITKLLERNFPLIDTIIPFPVNANYMKLSLAWRFFRELYLKKYNSYFCVADYTYPPRVPYNLFGSVVGYVADIPERIGIYRQHNAGLIPFEKKVIAHIFEKKSLYTRYGLFAHGMHVQELSRR
jgi:hypothetical protein